MASDFPGYAQVDIPASEFYEIFRKYDKDGNGYVEAEELDELFTDILSSMSEKSEISRKMLEDAKTHYMKAVDENYDRKLYPGELAKLLVPKENLLIRFRHLNELSSVDFIKVWNHYDHDKSGLLEQKDMVGFLGDLLKKEDQKVTMQRLDDYVTAMMDLFDISKDGRIAMIEFEKILPVEDNFLSKCKSTENFSEEIFNQIWAKYDQDGNGVLERAEVAAFVRDLWKSVESGASDPPAEFSENLCQLLCLDSDRVSKGHLGMFLRKQ